MTVSRRGLGSAWVAVLAIGLGSTGTAAENASALPHQVAGSLPHQDTRSLPRHDARSLPLDGEWRIEPLHQAGRIQIELKREWRNGADHSSWSSSFDAAWTDLTHLASPSSQEGPTAFDLVRDPGRFHAEGRMHRGTGSGHFVFVPDPAFREALERAGIHDAPDGELVRLAIHSIDRSWLRSLEGHPPRVESVDDLVRLKVHGVTGEFLDALRSAGLERLSVDDVVRLAEHGVDAAWIRQIDPDGRATADDLVRLKTHAIDPSYPSALKKLGVDSATFDDLVRLRAYDVSIEMVRELHDLGLRGLTADELIRLKTYGVGTPMVRGLHELGYADLTPDDLVRLKTYGVEVAEVRRATARRGRLPVDELIRLKQHGEL